MHHPAISGQVQFKLGRPTPSMNYTVADECGERVDTERGKRQAGLLPVAEGLDREVQPVKVADQNTVERK